VVLGAERSGGSEAEQSRALFLTYTRLKHLSS
jgi:hypothetical protein